MIDWWTGVDDEAKWTPYVRALSRGRTQGCESCGGASMGDGRASMTDAGTELMDGLVLYEHALSEQTQREILAFVEEQLSDGRAGSSTGKTYSAPPDTWLKTGQGREMLQYGAYTKCNKVQPTAVPPLPPILEALLDALQAAGVHGDQLEPCWHQFGFESIGHAQPAHLPVSIERFRYSQCWKQMPAGAAGCDQ